MTSTWTGWDGSVWNLSASDSPVRLREGVRGLSMPPVKRYSSASPAVPGSRFRGSITLEREVFWPLRVFTGSGQTWHDQDAAFWRTMDPEQPGVWAFTQPSGEVRRLRCRFVSDGSHTFQTNPGGIGWTAYGVALVADEQPYWEGEPQVRYFGADPPVLFFTADATVFALDPEQTVATATMDNSGDVEAYAVWTITGPSDSAVLGVGGRLIEVPFAVPDGQSLVVDPRPTAQTAIMSTGDDRTGDLGEVDFAPIPPGESVELSLELVGDGYISAALTPLHRRAW
jgi:hypothetical protein